jgi:gliding motility-associated-like protein
LFILLKFKFKHIVVVAFICSCCNAFAQQVKFIRNKGQWQDNILYKADIPGGDLFITPQGLVYNLYDEHALHENQHNGKDTIVMGQAIFLNFTGAQQNISAEGYIYDETAYNYFLGNDRKKWVSNTKACREVVLRNVYPHIDFKITGVDGGVKTSFIVRKGGNKDLIRLQYEGAGEISITDQQLIVPHLFGSIRELPPVSFITHGETLQRCPTQYVLAGDDNTVTYDVVLPKALTSGDSLIIDPSIVFSTFSGSVADNFGFTATYDKDGNAYGGGTVYSAGFPTKPGVYQLTFGAGPGGNSGGARDAGILKFSADGTKLLYATYLGGNNNEQPHSMSCDASGNLFILGTTRSVNFPVKSGYDNTHNGGYDLFVACLNPDGTDLLSSTFIGGAATDGINGEERRLSEYPTNYNYGDAYRGDIRLDASGNVYIASVTQSTPSQGLPLANATQPDFGGGLQDGWAIKLNHDLNQLLFSSYIGGSGVDAAYSVRITGNSFYVAGGSGSADLPGASTSGAFSFKGAVDGFVAKFTQAGSTFTRDRVIYHGTGAYDQSYFITTDGDNRVYITGQTTGTLSPVGSVFNETAGKQFITVFDEDLTTIVLQTTFGTGTYPKLSPSAFMVDKCKRVYLSGWGGASNRNYNMETAPVTGLPLTSDAYQSITDGSDFYLVIFNKNLSNIGYATYFGGARSQEHVDGGTSHFNEEGVVYQSVCAGCGGLSDFPTTPNAYSRTNNGKRPYDPSVGGCNNAVFKFDAKPNPVAPVMNDALITLTITDTADYTFDITDANGDPIVIDSIYSSLFSLSSNPPTVSIITNKPGLIRARLQWITNCNTRADTFYIQVKFREISCENLSQTEGVIKIIVNRTPIIPIDLNCLKQTGNNAFEVSWKPIPYNKYINRINVYRSKNNGAFDSLTSINTPFITTSITDFVTNPETDNYCYRIAGVNSCNVKSNFSRQSCSLEGDSISPGAYNFAHDTIWYAYPTDTLETLLNITDNEFNDSMYLSYNGSLLSQPGAKVTHINGVGNASFRFRFIADCSQVGDTFSLNFGIRDNSCPTPLRETGRVRIVVIPLPPGNTPPLQCLKYITNEKVGVKWLNTSNNRYTSKYNLIKQTASGNIITVGTYDVINTGYIEQQVNSPFTVKQCFALVSIDNCNIASDTGEFTCTPWPDSLYPPGVLPHYVSVAENKYIEISWPQEEGMINEVFRTDRVLTQKELLYSTDKTRDTTWTDQSEKLEVDKHSYCYMIERINECGLRSKASSIACTIVLKGQSQPFEHKLTWTEYDYFNNGLERYDILAKDLTEDDFRKKNTSYHKETYCIDNQLNKETGVFYYQAVAVENEERYRSLSNIVELRQKPLLHIPNAYTANGDNLNDTWNIVPVFVKEYEMKVFDRWGRKVFETTDKHKQMGDKDQQNTLLPCDVYAYVITYTGFSGEVFTRTGNVTVLK